MMTCARSREGELRRERTCGMGDKGGKKDRNKDQRQKKKREQDKMQKKKDKQPKAS